MLIAPPSKERIPVDLEIANARIEFDSFTGQFTTIFDHRVFLERPRFLEGTYTIDVIYREVIGGIDQKPPVERLLIPGDLNLAQPFNTASEPGFYNLIQITAGSGVGLDRDTFHDQRITIVPPPPFVPTLPVQPPIQLV